MSDSRQSKIAEAVAELLDAPTNLPDGSSFASQSVNVDILEWHNFSCQCMRPLEA